MDRSDAKGLPAGSPEHYSAYVGPPGQYDFMGATQFRLACTLGLREHHRLLDFGCGSLRAGRLFLPYLNAGCYFGVEPNRWLIEEAIANEFGGQEFVRLKQPRFDHNDDFRADVFGVNFDFIIAQSIFSHAGPDLVAKGLASFATVLKRDGLIMATFVPSTTSGDVPSGWLYPGCVAYQHDAVLQLAAGAGLATRKIPWFHPRQDWYLFAHDPARLPSDEDAERHLSGRVLWDAELQRREI